MHWNVYLKLSLPGRPGMLHDMLAVPGCSDHDMFTLSECSDHDMLAVPG